MSDHDPFQSAWRALWPQTGTALGEQPQPEPAAVEPAEEAVPTAEPATEPAAVPEATMVAAEKRRRVSPPRRQSDRHPLVDPLDATIPILTQVVELSDYAGETLPRSLDEVDWSSLAVRVRERVLEGLLTRPGSFLDEPIRERLPRIVERGARALAAEIRSELEEAMRDAVAHAVTEELTKLQEEIVSRMEAALRLAPASSKDQP
ncbi:MAG: hypothetical protein K0B16_17820 [Burkholderiaceae bacterium]|nr:hypothetical protein [Burkholderiaceae bacterium]